MAKSDKVPWTRLAVNNPPRLVNAKRDAQATARMTKVLQGRTVAAVRVKDASEEGGVVFESVTLEFTDGVTFKCKVSGIEAVMDCTVGK